MQNAQVKTRFTSLREGFILKKVKNDGIFHVRACPPPPYKMEKLFLIFLGIRPFFESTLKNSHFALENANFGEEISTKDLKFKVRPRGNFHI